MTIDPAYIFLWRALAFFLMVGALSGVALALLLIFKPHLLGRVNHFANRWVSTNHIGQALDRSISIESWFYKHHHVTGIVVALGAIYMFFYFGFRFDKAGLMLRWGVHVQPKLLDGLLDALVLTSLVGAATALMVGLFLWLRPSLLRGIEEKVNRWVSTSSATHMLDVPHDQMDRFVARHSQRVGWLLLLGSIYLFFVVFRLLA